MQILSCKNPKPKRMGRFLKQWRRPHILPPATFGRRRLHWDISGLSNMSDYPAAYMQYSPFHAVIILVFSVLACIAVALRLWARRIQNLALSVSDYGIILGLVGNLYSPEMNAFAQISRSLHWASPLSTSTVCFPQWA